MIRQSKVAGVARRAVAARKAGKTSYTEGSATFLLDKGSYCARFVRQCCEATAGLPPFGAWFAAPTAREMEAKLRAAGKVVGGVPMPGDIIGLNKQSYWAGHIGIFLGGGLFAENASDPSRGDPRAAGTKISPISAVLPELSGYFRPFESDSIRLILQKADGPYVIACNLKVEGGVSRVDLRAVAEALGFEVTDHLQDLGKVYLTPTGRTDDTKLGCL